MSATHGSAGQNGDAQQDGSAGQNGDAQQDGSAGQNGDAQQDGSAGQNGDAQQDGSAGQEGNTDAIRVFLVDDHEIVRRGVAELLDREPDLVVVGEAGGAIGAVEAIDELHPDVAVIDVRLGDGNGITVCRDVRSQCPDTACLILTSFDDDQAFVDAAMAGAAGYVLKQIRGNELVSSIRQVAKGRILLDQSAVQAGLGRLREQEPHALTPQEHKIFELIGNGLSNREIAAEMFLAEKTVKNYVSNLLAKLGMSRRTEAAAFAARLDERQRQRFH